MDDPMDAVRRLASIVVEIGRELQFNEPDKHRRDWFHARTVDVLNLLDEIGHPEATETEEASNDRP